MVASYSTGKRIESPRRTSWSYSRKHLQTLVWSLRMSCCNVRKSSTDNLGRAVCLHHFRQYTGRSISFGVRMAAGPIASLVAAGASMTDISAKGYTAISRRRNIQIFSRRIDAACQTTLLYTKAKSAHHRAGGICLACTHHRCRSAHAALARTNETTGRNSQRVCSGRGQETRPERRTRPCQSG